MAVQHSSFVEGFIAAHGRPPRILHIGNIANNAYINAKILNESGYDCDVIAPDYYHIMGAPEWEDVDFAVGPKNQSAPDWTEIDTNGYVRPRWFVQGPMLLCIEYLNAKRNGNTRLANALWTRLAHANRTLVRPKRVLPQLWKGFGSSGWWVQIIIIRNILMNISYRPFKDIVNSLARRLTGNKTPNDGRPFFVVKGVAFAMTAICYSIGRLCRVWAGKAALEEKKSLEFTRNIYEDWPELINEPTGLISTLHSFDRLLHHYDIIHAYATAPILPYLLKKHPFVAYEHGTIREIPYEPTLMGRLTAAAYGAADVVMLTNADALYSLPKLRQPDKPFIRALHGFDLRTIQRRLEICLKRPGRVARFGIAPGRPLFFSPARHDWAIKGNDIMLRALARVCAVGHSPVMVLVRWGAELERSCQLITELGIEENVLWVDPLGKFELLAAYHDSDAVLDQFVLECFGAVSVEVMAVGKAALLTSVDQALMERFFGSRIPLFSAKTTEEVGAALLSIIEDPQSAKQTAAAAQAWIHTNHGHERVLYYLDEAYAATGLLSSQDQPARGGDFAEATNRQ